VPKPQTASERFDESCATRLSRNDRRRGAVPLMRTGRARTAGVAALSLALVGCSETVWVKPGATLAESEAATEQCLSDAYLQAPSAPAVRTLGSDVAPPSFTTCSGVGVSGVCVTSRGQYTRPLTIRYDANARNRSQIFRQCMVSGGWSEQTRTAGATSPAAEDDWSRGFDVGAKDGADARCSPPSAGLADAHSWSLGCQSGQRAR
jgi:hypothetical protein